MTSLVKEIRLKLHIKFSNDPEVKNLWMCLSYDHKPTIGHVIDHVKKNMLDKTQAISDCKLYLDDYWLPPYEDSRLIRENDCIRVEVSLETVINATKTPTAVEEKLTELNKNVLSHIKATEQRITDKQKQIESTEYGKTGLSPEEIATVEAATRAAATTNTDYYNHYYDKSAYYSTAGASTNDIAAYNYWLNNDYFNNQLIKDNSTIVQEVKTTKPYEKLETTKATKQKPTTVTKSPKETTSSHKKFAIGSYAHLLSVPVQPPTTKQNKKKNGKQQQAPSKLSSTQFQDVTESDNLSEEQLIDNYYEAITSKKKDNYKAEQKANANCQEFEKISANVNSAGNKKWKNSTQPTKANGPKHIIFKSSGSSDDSSSSSSESESDKMPAKEQLKKNIIKAPTSPMKKITLDNTKANKYYEPTKQEQLDAVSYNRSYFVKNTKNLIEFKKTFNEEKLNAPQSEEFADRSEYPSTHKVSKKSKNNTEKLMNTSTDSTSDVKNKRDNQRKKSPSPAKINYDNYQSLVGAPRVDDKIAFQILEISSNFTPEVSDYKTGTVIEFNETNNEITLEMNNKYNHVLKRSNKFSVILDETDKEAYNEEIDEASMSPRQIRNSQETDNILKVDWRNLMNLKLVVDDKQFAKQQQFNEAHRPAVLLHV